MIVGEAIAKLTIIVTAEIFEDGVSHPFVQSKYSSFADRAFATAKDISICGTISNLERYNKLAGIDCFYSLGALGNPGLLCLIGSRMFINLIEAGQSEVKNGSGNGTQSGRGSIVSDIQFGDPSGPHSIDQSSTGSQIADVTVSEIQFVDCENIGAVSGDDTSSSAVSK
ncbi:hypothetical protein PNOK_0898300 [Pyrrhoderma noxium]|uniref:Uncharacterized protein n=1 Tax=Pyrrhoderma noxium TaxID=2282107 RepID=A0A286U6P0_9AGAM|nr:hypothetical protein PNOK_0898300 [Pyrrhoderma noxium]